MKTSKSQHDWCLWFAWVEDKPAHVWVDCAANTIAGKIMPFLVTVFLENLGTERHNSYPTEEIYYSVLYKIEAKISKIANNSYSRYIGRMVTNGKATFGIYTDNYEDIEKKLNKIIPEYVLYHARIYTRQDKNWKIYRNIFPPKKEKQKYDNSTLIKAVLHSGSNPQKEHHIDHALFFDKKADRDNYLKELKKLKFLFEKYEIFDDPGTENPFTLELTIRSPLNNDLIDNVTNILIDLAEKYNAVYDGWGTEIVK